MTTAEAPAKEGTSSYISYMYYILFKHCNIYIYVFIYLLLLSHIYI